jgi:hypothetical protein
MDHACTLAQQHPCRIALRLEPPTFHPAQLRMIDAMQRAWLHGG